ncbi:unnamed protein product [Macrosiphum euphorbiae]|uniref:Uncharacterized protein n=1 Tax=Macrosiphum euphorbiae TaxID=13131 RepID=A0AAV0VJ86_9HEMI|nr:unnamed protein product [Macrosiphum euphorbiae]
MPSDDCQIVLRTDKIPSGEHERRFSLPVYPLMFWMGEDGYHFEIYEINPVTDPEKDPHLFDIKKKI